jgi:hypothetical protein
LQPHAELLAFRAPYLEEKLTREQIVSSLADAVAYFDELKKYLWLCNSVTTHRIPMLSRLVDEVWHQFVLFTTEYTDFCERFFGRYVHHTPNEAPSANDEPAQSETALTAATNAEFAALYEREFGPLPRLWDDSESVGLRTRLFRTGPQLHVRTGPEKSDLVAVDDDRLIARIVNWFEPALRFIVENEVFLVRELPSIICEEDKVRFARLLMRRGVARIAP